jgi:hypothetical protein
MYIIVILIAVSLGFVAYFKRERDRRNYSRMERLERRREEMMRLLRKKPK